LGGGEVNGKPRRSHYRLTKEDVALFERVAESMIRHSEWRRFTRNRNEQAEYFEIQTDPEADPAFSLGRCATGNYVFLNHRTGDVRFAGSFSALLDSVKSLRA
jgi:hypothetical protein